MLLFCCLMALGEPGLKGFSLGELGFRRPNYITFDLVGDQILAVSPEDNRAALFTETGQVRVHLSKNADPSFHYPRILGVTQDEVLMVVASKVRSYDHQLGPKSRTLPPFGIPIRSSRALGKDHFMLYSFGSGPHALIEIELKEGTWAVLRSLFPITFGPSQAGTGRAPLNWVDTNGGLVMQWFPIGMGDTDFLVEVFQAEGAQAGEQVMALQGIIEDSQAAKTHWPYLMNAAVWGKNYVVVVAMVDPNLGKPTSQNLHIFSGDGHFKERRPLPARTLLKPLGGSRRILLLSRDGLVVSELK